MSLAPEARASPYWVIGPYVLFGIDIIANRALGSRIPLNVSFGPGRLHP